MMRNAGIAVNLSGIHLASNFAAIARYTFKQNVILSPKPDLKSNDLRISQMHALDLVDLNGDGIPDVIVANKKGSFIHLSQPAK